MKKILYISAILLFVFAVYGKAQAKDGGERPESWRVGTNASASINGNMWSKGGDDEGESRGEVRPNTLFRPNIGGLNINSSIRASHDNESATETEDGEEFDNENHGATEVGDDNKTGSRLFPLFQGGKHEGALDMIQKQESSEGTHSPFLKDNKGESDNRSPRADFRMKIGMRFTFAMHNLSNLRTRLSTHIDFLKTKNVDVTTATTLLATADTDIESAKTAVDALQTKIDSIVATVTTNVTATTTADVTITPPLDDATKAEIRTLATAAKDAIVKAYQSLGAVIGEIKNLHQQNNIDDEDTTPDTSTNGGTATTTNQ